MVGLLATLSAQAGRATLAARATLACLVIDGKFSRRGCWPLVAEREITWINAVPTIITLLAMDPPAERVPGRIRFVRSASAPLPSATLRRSEDTFGLPVVETYGMTEAASMIAANPVGGPRKAGSAGLAAGPQVRVAERAGSEFLPYPAGTVSRVQSFLLTQPGVGWATVIAARDEVLGERPVAYVAAAGVRRQGRATSPRAS